MNLTRAQYDLETGTLYIQNYDVIEKPNTYKSSANIFNKSEEEYVRYLKGSYNSPYLEVYTVDTKAPVEILQSLISDWLKERISLVPFRTYENRKWNLDINLVQKYLESINLEDYNLENENFPLKEDIQNIYDKLISLQNPRFWDLQSLTAIYLKDLQEEIELD